MYDVCIDRGRSFLNMQATLSPLMCFPAGVVHPQGGTPTRHTTRLQQNMFLYKTVPKLGPSASPQPGDTFSEHENLPKQK